MGLHPRCSACLFFPDGSCRPNYGSPNMTVSLARLPQDDYLRCIWIQVSIIIHYSRSTLLSEGLVQPKFSTSWTHLLLVEFSTHFYYTQPTIPQYPHSRIKLDQPTHSYRSKSCHPPGKRARITLPEQKRPLTDMLPRLVRARFPLILSSLIACSDYSIEFCSIHKAINYETRLPSNGTKEDRKRET